MCIRDSRFVEQGDGSVAIELPAQTSIEFESTTPDGDKITAKVNYEQTDPVMTASGDPDKLTYDYNAPSAKMEISSLTVNGLPIGSNVARGVVNVTNMAYALTTSVDALRSIEQTMSLGVFDYDIAFADPEGEGTFNMKGCLLYTSPSPRDRQKSRMPSSA